MAVGRGSMERASKAAAKKPAAPKKTTKAAPKESVIAAASPEVMGEIVYQSSSQILERAAEPNEQFALGDAMPIYYF